MPEQNSYTTTYPFRIKELKSFSKLVQYYPNPNKQIFKANKSYKLTNGKRITPNYSIIKFDQHYHVNYEQILEGNNVWKACPMSFANNKVTIDLQPRAVKIEKTNKFHSLHLKNEIRFIQTLYFSKGLVKNKKYHYLDMPYFAGQELYEIIKNHFEDPENSPIRFFESRIELILELLIDFKKIQEANIIHRDIKPENTIWGNDKKMHIIDFDLSKFMNEKIFDHNGTPIYMAPEAFTGNVSQKSDNFSIGIIIGLIFGAYLNEARESLYALPPLIFKYFFEDIIFLKKLKDTRKIFLKAKLENYIKTVTHPDPSQRPSVTEMLTFFNEIKIKYCLKSYFAKSKNSNYKFNQYGAHTQTITLWSERNKTNKAKQTVLHPKHIANLTNT